MNRTLIMVFFTAMFAGILVPGHAQTDHVVINEVDTNPPGSDAATISERIELYNPTDSDVDLSGWMAASTTALKRTLAIPDGTVIGPGQFAIYSYQRLWFADSNESVELRDSDGNVIDKTPVISDLQDDYRSWQRVHDGEDTDTVVDWKFAVSTFGGTNGRAAVAQEDKEIAVTVASKSPTYLFGDTAVIEGAVSEEVRVVKPFFRPEPVTVQITGPSFERTVTLYPDPNLEFKTTLSLHRVLGIVEGTYSVSASYAGATSETSFAVGRLDAEQGRATDYEISISADKQEYLPGETVGISATTSRVVPLEGLGFVLLDSDGNTVSAGNLFPTDGKFATSIYLQTVNPAYGTHTISARYADKTASASFEVARDTKEDVPISLGTDKAAYRPGDTVTITGRVNHVWVGALDIVIAQTKQVSLPSLSSAGPPGFKITDIVRVEGNGTFSYAFTIPDSKFRLGDYLIDVSKSIGSVNLLIHVVEDPENFAASTGPLTLSADRDSYELGQTITVGGFVQDRYGTANLKTGSPVFIAVLAGDGQPLDTRLAVDTKSDDQTKPVGYDFTAIPEASGRYSATIDVSPGAFSEGSYMVRAKASGHTATDTFSIVNPPDVRDTTAALDKEVYGIGEAVRLAGTVPPVAEPNVSIKITRPDGTIVNSGTVIDNQKFSWSWVPTAVGEHRGIKDGAAKSIYGTYKITVQAGYESADLFFRVSADPENDSLPAAPIFVTTEKPLYTAGARLTVTGNVITQEQTGGTAAVPERVQLLVFDGSAQHSKLLESFVHPDLGGEFVGSFDLPTGIFGEGTYAVKAAYSGFHSFASFSVVPDFDPRTDEPVSLMLFADAEQYSPGDTVLISGEPDRPVYLDAFRLGIIRQADNGTLCGPRICGTHADPPAEIRPSPTGSFSHRFAIPDAESSAGMYEVVVDAGFDMESVLFSVAPKPSAALPDTAIEKASGFTGSAITIPVAEKTVGNSAYSPRVVSGSLVIPLRGDASETDLRVSSASGTCIIGPASECVVSESTRKPGQIYEAVRVGEKTLNVRYSGPDAQLEKFSISAGEPGGFLPYEDWSVEVLKDDQPSRFSYKVTYRETP